MRPGQRDDLRLDGNGAAIGTASTVAFELRAQTLELGALRLGVGFEASELGLVGTGIDNARFHFREIAHHGLFAKGCDFRFLRDALNDLCDFAINLALQALLLE